MGYIIDEVFAFVAVDDDDDEGVMAAKMGETWYPLVAADLVRIQQYIPLANATGIDYKIKHFQLVGDISDDYIKQFKDIAKPTETTDNSGNTGDGKRKPDRPRGANGGLANDA